MRLELKTVMYIYYACALYKAPAHILLQWCGYRGKPPAWRTKAMYCCLKPGYQLWVGTSQSLLVQKGME